MAMDKYEDLYEGFFDKQEEFMKELRERCTETKRYTVKPDELKLYNGQVSGSKLILRRIEDEKVDEKTVPISPENELLWKSADVDRIGLFIEFPDENGVSMLAPLSQMSKLSLGNRAKLTFNGDLGIPINKIALAKVYEDMVKRETKKENVQIISVYGKVQAVMTEVYSPIGHDEYFEKVLSNILQRFGNSVQMKRGYISQKWSRATWDIGEYQNGNHSKKIRLGISAMDSQTGHSSAVLQPVIFSGRKMDAMLFDDAWHSKHMALSDAGITEAIESVYLSLNDNAQRLLDTIGITLKDPGHYARNVCTEINRLAKKMSGILLPAKTINSFITTVDGLGYIRSNITVWDIIELLWDIPASTGGNENHRDGLMKTVSRVLTLNHQALDKQ